MLFLHILIFIEKQTAGVQVATQKKHVAGFQSVQAEKDFFFFQAVLIPLLQDTE